jgi:hypothetical protein
MGIIPETTKKLKKYLNIEFILKKWVAYMMNKYMIIIN